MDHILCRNVHSKCWDGQSIASIMARKFKLMHFIPIFCNHCILARRSKSTYSRFSQTFSKHRKMAGKFKLRLFLSFFWRLLHFSAKILHYGAKIQTVPFYPNFLKISFWGTKIQICRASLDDNVMIQLSMIWRESSNMLYFPSHMSKALNIIHDIAMIYGPIFTRLVVFQLLSSHLSTVKTFLQWCVTLRFNKLKVCCF